jgi:hypothetical protein
MTSLRNKVIKLAYTTKSASFRSELLRVLSRYPEISKDDLASVWGESQATRSKYKPGDFGYWWCVENGMGDIEGQHYPMDINCGLSRLTSLKGAPKSVGGSFNCGVNNLTSLKGGPQKVGRGFFCSGGKLTSLKGAPKSVGGDCDFWNNKLTSLRGAPKSVGGDFKCSKNPGNFTEEDVRAVSKVNGKILV